MTWWLWTLAGWFALQPFALLWWWLGVPHERDEAEYVEGYRLRRPFDQEQDAA